MPQTDFSLKTLLFLVVLAIALGMGLLHYANSLSLILFVTGGIIIVAFAMYASRLLMRHLKTTNPRTCLIWFWSLNLVIGLLIIAPLLYVLLGLLLLFGR